MNREPWLRRLQYFLLRKAGVLAIRDWLDERISQNRRALIDSGLEAEATARKTSKRLDEAEAAQMTSENRISAMVEETSSLREELAKTHAHIERLETRLHESKDGIKEDAHHRWRYSLPDANLTWGFELTGTDFITNLQHRGLFTPSSRILEIGPGYGRLMLSIQKLGCEFSQYLGVDISAEQVKFLTEKFGNSTVRYVQANAEEVELEDGYDVLFSSLTFKHLYPSFELALANLARFIAPGGTVAIDFIEGERRMFEEDQITYIRWYSRTELVEIFRRCGIEIVDFDTVQHAPDFERLLAIGRKGS